MVEVLPMAKVGPGDEAYITHTMVLLCLWILDALDLGCVASKNL